MEHQAELMGHSYGGVLAPPAVLPAVQFAQEMREMAERERPAWLEPGPRPPDNGCAWKEASVYLYCALGRQGWPPEHLFNDGHGELAWRSPFPAVPTETFAQIARTRRPVTPEELARQVGSACLAGSMVELWQLGEAEAEAWVAMLALEKRR